MKSIILRTSAGYLLVLLVLFSVFALLRGHNEPGGGFIGGLLTVGGFAIYGLAYGSRGVRDVLRVDPRSLVGAGLVLALAAALAGPLAGQPVLTGIWGGRIPGIGKVSTVLLFDVGVHLVVAGAVVLILMALTEED